MINKEALKEKIIEYFKNKHKDEWERDKERIIRDIDALIKDGELIKSYNDESIRTLGKNLNDNVLKMLESGEIDRAKEFVMEIINHPEYEKTTTVYYALKLLKEETIKRNLHITPYQKDSYKNATFFEVYLDDKILSDRRLFISSFSKLERLFYEVMYIAKVIRNKSGAKWRGITNKELIGIVAKVAWSFNRWRGISQDLKEFHLRNRYGYDFVKKFGYAHEFWNFNEEFDSEYYYGFVQTTNNPVEFIGKNGLIVFISKNVVDGKWYFVGFYGIGEYLRDEYDTQKRIIDLLPEEIKKNIKNHIEESEGKEREYLERVISGEETYKANLRSKKEYSTVFDEDAYVEISTKDISVGQVGFSYIGQNENIKPETIKRILMKAKENHENLLKQNLDENRRKEIERIIEKIDKVLELYFKDIENNSGGGTIPEELKEKIDKILDNKGQIILYGVPGTGKTWLAWNYVKEKTGNDDSKYEFITFHQSYSYEDFIEGFRPKNDKNGNITYEVEDGIFKKMCILAIWEVLKDKIFENVNFYKVSLGEKHEKEIFDYCIENNEIAVGYNDDTDYTGCKTIEELKEKRNKDEGFESIKNIVLEMKKGDIVLVSYGLDKIRAIGKVVGDYEYRKDSPLNKYGFYQFRKVKWLWIGKNEDEYINVKDIRDTNFWQNTLYKLDKNSLNIEFLKEFIINNLPYKEIKEIVVKKLKEHKKSKNVFKEGYFENAPKYYLIIDEINRGNISNILGELITLLEMDKRLTGKNEVIVTLLYSKEPFAVPPNLYIIGTMNTADRSIALLDIALRRRFGFIEIEPEGELLTENKLLENWRKICKKMRNIKKLKMRLMNYLMS
ncbi:AAA family ATPase [Methanocaldococcus sp. FS406-22]|uniref:AAA family ATPase n=1 Tax=Methanocaldococcus sp. (strain FS406-22) TaxID=644281 RepID=UPI0001BF4BDF|nr:AAA family ATPase [Methanocaldococcus sp. FS406-22]